MLRHIHVTIFAMKKAISSTYDKCVSVTLDIQHAK